MTNEERQIVLRFAMQMKSYREAKGISQEKLAEYANLHRTFIGSIERAEKNSFNCNSGENSQSIKYQYF